MNFQQFKTVIETLEKLRNRSHAAYDAGIDLINYDDAFHKVISILFHCVFDDDGMGWIDWFLYERPGFSGGKPLSANDENGNEICHNIESLWETVKPHRKQ